MKTVFPDGRCVVCDSEFRVYLRDIHARLSKKDIPVYYCMDCGSLMTPSGYKEDDERLKVDAQWHIDVQERNTNWSRNFFKAVRHRFPHVKSIIEIGCGTGTLLNVGRSEFGMRVIGFDMNQHAISLGKSVHKGLNLVDQLWCSQTLQESYDLIVCISLFEHLEKPRLLMEEIAEYCKRHKSAAFISVPYFERDRWPLLLEPNAGTNPTSELRLVDVHIVHYTKRGLVTMAGHFGATSAIYFPRGWRGHWIEFSDRVVF